MPPIQTPLDQAAPALAAHAHAGNARAACRLALELLLCRQSLRMDSLRGLQSGLADSIAAEGDLARALQTDEQTLRTAEHARVCRGVDSALQSQAEAFLVQAAHARVPYAMYLYATGEHILQEPGFAAMPEFDDWRRTAPAMMIAARDAGIPDAVSFLANAYANDWTLANSLFADDAVKANAHWLLQSLLRSGNAGDGHPFLRVEVRDDTASLKLARQLHERNFGGRLFPDVQAYPSPAYGLRSTPDQHTSNCQARTAPVQ